MDGSYAFNLWIPITDVQLSHGGQLQSSMLQPVNNLAGELFAQ